MSNMPFDKSRLNRYITLSGIIISFFIIIYGILNKPLYGILGITSMIAFIVWMFYGKEIIASRENYVSKRGCIFAIMCYFVLFTASVLVIRFRDNDFQVPLLYFFLIALMAGFIFLTALMCPRGQRFIVLLEIVLLGTNYVVAEVTIFPSVLGVDPWWHQYFTNMIVIGNQIPSGTNYSKIPLFHVLIAQSMIITGFDYKSITVVIGSLVIIVSALIVYSFGSNILGNYRIGLIGALMVVTAESVIRMSYWFIPTSLAGIIVILAIYLIMDITIQRTIRGKITIMLLMFSIVLMHSVTALSFAIILIASYLATLVISHYTKSKDNHFPITMPLIFLSVMLAWWMYVSTSYMITMAEFIRNGFNFEASLGISSSIQSIPIVESIVNNMGSFFFFSIGIIGLLYLLSSRASYKMKIFGIISATPLTIAFLSLIVGGYYFQDRWWYFAELMMSIPVGLALYSLAGDRGINLRSILVTSIVIGVVFLMIICPSANMTNNMISPNSVERLALTPSEITAMNFAHKEYSGIIATDRYYSKQAIYSQYYSISILDKGMQEFNFTSYSNNMILLRSEMLAGASERDASLGDVLSQTPEYMLNRQGFNTIANNGAVKFYLK